MARTRQASGGTAAEPPELHVRRPNLSLNDLLRFVIKPLHVTLGGLIGCLRRFQGGSCTLYLLLPSAKVGRLVFMLSCPQSLGGLAFLLFRALSFLHGGIHLRLQVTHARRDGTWPGQRKGCKERGAESSDRRQPARQPYCAARWRIYLPSKALLHCAPVVCLRFLGDQLQARLRMSGIGAPPSL
jgi:hypothetical protein